MSDIEKQHLLGVGSFGWTREERVSNRYGSFFIYPGFKRPTVERFCGKRGKIVAVVTKTNVQHHIGDLFLDIYPVMPEVGERIEIGEGELFIDEVATGDTEIVNIGLKPEGEAWTTPWLHVKSLYRAIDQIVEIYFEEE